MHLELIHCVAFWSQCEPYKLHATQDQHSCLLGFHKGWRPEAVGDKHARGTKNKLFCTASHNFTQKKIKKKNANVDQSKDFNEVWIYLPVLGKKIPPKLQSKGQFGL